jgi:RNA polymerase-binding protein DksA
MPNDKGQKKMSQKDLDFFKKLLLDLKESLLFDLKAMNKDSQDGESRDLSGHVQHMADVATDMYDKEFALGLASKDRESLHKIELALKRITDGTYGICAGTGKMISKERLKAIPYAEYSLDYQEELEKKGF